MDFSKKTLVELREIAKEKGLKGITALRKPELIQRLMEVSEETKREPEVMPERTMERKPVSQRAPMERQTRPVRQDRMERNDRQDRYERRPMRRNENGYGNGGYITVITITMAAIVMSGTITTAITITATITTAIIITAITIIMAIITIAAIIIMAVTVTITAVITIIAIIMATNEKMIPIAIEEMTHTVIEMIEEMIHTVREHIIRMKELITPRDRSSMNVCHSRTIITIIVHRSIMMEAMG